MADITTTAEIRGKVDGLQRSLRTAESSVKSSAAKINGTKAELKIGIDIRKLDRDLADANRKIDKVLRDSERRQVAAAKKASQNQLALGKSLVSGANPTSALGNFGGQALAAVAAVKIAEVAVSASNAVSRGRQARARGDIEGEVAAESDLNAMAASIPLVGELGAQIRERITGEKAYIENLTFLTKQQEKVTAFMKERADRSRQLTEGDEARVRDLSKAEAMRTAMPTKQAVIIAEAALDDELRSQERRNAIDVDERTTAGQAARGVRDALGTNLAGARGRARREVGHARTREFVARQAAEQEAREEAEREGKATRGRLEARRQARHGAIRREFFAVQETEQRIAESRTSGEAETRQAELRAGGRPGEAAVEAIAEQLRKEIAGAEGDPELEAQAKRRAQAELRAMEREVSARGVGRAEAVSGAAFTDLGGRLSGADDPGVETNQILKDRIAAALDKIERNTAGGARTI